jgi:ABC-type sugar transport system substrate-binding protein
MKTKFLAVLMCVVTAFFLFGAEGREKASSVKSGGELALNDITIGYVQAGPAPYYQASADATAAAIAKVSAKSIILNSQDSPQREISNVEDLVARRVNAILVFTTNSDKVFKTNIPKIVSLGNIYIPDIKAGE